MVLPAFNYAFLITYANPISQAQRTIDAKNHDAGSVVSNGIVCQGINQSTAWIAKMARLAQQLAPRLWPESIPGKNKEHRHMKKAQTTKRSELNKRWCSMADSNRRPWD